MYGKIFDSMYDGTLADDWQAMVTFQQFIVLCDADGVLDMTPSAIARRTGIPLEYIEAGIKSLEGADSTSRSHEHDGRRIKLIDEDRPFGWFIVNYQKYKNLRDADELREYNRVRKQAQRDKERGRVAVSDDSSEADVASVEGDVSQDVTGCPTMSQDVPPCHEQSPHIDIDIYKTHTQGAAMGREPVPKDFKPDKQTLEFCAWRQYPDVTEDMVSIFIHGNESSGWRSADWQAEFKKWLGQQKVKYETDQARWLKRAKNKKQNGRGESDGGFLQMLRDEAGDCKPVCENTG